MRGEGKGHADAVVWAVRFGGVDVDKRELQL